MPDFSIANIVSACEAIKQHAVSTSIDLDVLHKSVNFEIGVGQQILSLSRKLEKLRGAAEELREALIRASVIPEMVQSVAHVAVQAASDASSVVEKQIRSIQPRGAPMEVDLDVISGYTKYLEANLKLFSALTQILKVSSAGDQEAKLKTIVQPEGTELLRKAIEASQGVMASESVTGDKTETSPSNLGYTDRLSVQTQSPPNYSMNEDNEKGKAPAGLLASLSNSLQAVTSSMWAKPEPMVVAMCQSAKAGNVGHLEGFVAQGANINGKNEEGYTPLICAIHKNHVAAVQFLITAGADRSARDSGGERKPPLFHASHCGNVEIVEILIEAGADMKERSWSGQPFFIDVACGENLDVIKCFLEHGAEANMVSMSGRTIFVHALRAGSLNHLQLLEKYGGDVNARDISGRLALHMALNQDRMDIVHFLLEHGADPNMVDISGSRLLISAIQRNNYELVRTLLTRGANPNVSDMLGRHSIVLIMENTEADEITKSDIVRLFLTKGVDPNRSDRGTPLICYAMKSGSTASLRQFLEHKANPNKRMNRQEPLLLYAIDHGRDDQALLLLDHGADPNKADKNGRTPLIEAIQRDAPRLFEKLLAKGANANKPGQVTPLALARLSGKLEAVRLLEAKGAKVPSRRTAPPRESSPQTGASSKATLSTNDQELSGPKDTPPPYTDSPVSQEISQDTKG